MENKDDQQTKYCSNCGHVLHTDDKFCSGCGVPNSYYINLEESLSQPQLSSDATSCECQ